VAAAPGWYPNPSGDRTTDAYWDGFRWVTTRPSVEHPPPASTPLFGPHQLTSPTPQRLPSSNNRVIWTVGLISVALAVAFFAYVIADSFKPERRHQGCVRWAMDQGAPDVIATMWCNDRNDRYP